MLNAYKVHKFLEDFLDVTSNVARHVFIYSLVLLQFALSITLVLAIKENTDILLLIFMSLIFFISGLITLVVAIKYSLEDYLECQEQKVEN